MNDRYTLIEQSLYDKGLVLSLINSNITVCIKCMLHTCDMQN